MSAGDRGRDTWVSLGMAVSAVSAGFSSFNGLRSLAEATGWTAMAPLFALCIDAYALTAIRVWLTSAAGSDTVRSFARWNAILAILLSLGGNAAWHLIAAGLLPVTWHVVMTVGAVPPIILGLVTHLAVLRRTAAEGIPHPSVAARTDVAVSTVSTDRSPVPKDVGPSSGRPMLDAPAQQRHATDEELLGAARLADAAHQARHGRPISRDSLRRELRIGGTRATQLLRRLREEVDQPTL